MPSLGLKLARAFRLRCPRCGSGGILASRFALKKKCATCGLVLDRGEEDHWLGAFTINFVVGEGFAAVVAIVVVVMLWPRAVPGVIVGIGLAILTPVVFYPYSKTLWLALDLQFRPSEPGDVSGNAPR